MPGGAAGGAILIHPLEPRRRRRWLTLLWLLAAGWGLFHCWTARFTMRSDGISYLDIADGILRGDWEMALNGYWSPLYPWLLSVALRLLQPSPYWEFPVVRLVDFRTYLAGLACFHFFLTELVRFRRGQTGESFPEWVWLLLGGASLLVWCRANCAVAAHLPAL